MTSSRIFVKRRYARVHWRLTDAALRSSGARVERWFKPLTTQNKRHELVCHELVCHELV